MIVSTLALLAVTQTKQFPKAPELVGTQWLNTKAPITLADRKGKVTLVHFWTYQCYNCLNNLPAVARLTSRFKGLGVVTLGIHTPETEAEKKFENVVAALPKLKIEYPVLFDGKNENWNNWKQSYWPTLYVIDKKGLVRFQWQGELNYKGQDGEEQAARAVKQLLDEK
jgi:peroxiredoxin